MSENFKPHLFVKNVHSSQDYTTPPGPPIKSLLPKRDRITHGEFIYSSLYEIWETYNQETFQRAEASKPVKEGEYITFFGAEKQLLELDSLSSDGAKLLNVKTNSENKSQIATVYIPENKKEKLLGKIEKYIGENTDKGLPKNQPLVEKIETIRKSTIEFIWSSASEYLPKEEHVWCELWLAINQSEIDAKRKKLNYVCKFLGIAISDISTIFPERVIINVKLNYSQLVELIFSIGEIAEIRRAEELNSFWLDQTIINREKWIESAIKNVVFEDTNSIISILDSGINNGHLLIKDALSDIDRLTVNENWGKNDSGHKGHGTSMAGIALYGNLSRILESNSSFVIRHRLESIKVLPPNGFENELDLWHYITQDAVNIATVNNPDYKRIYCMAITGKNQNDFGKPSTWSAYLDDIVFGEDYTDKKIFVVSAGNVREEEDYLNYPESNLNLSVESPAQAWNVITIGAFTEKVLPNSNTVANKFELSPYSRTSNSWGNFWPIKPEVVFEGGNLEKLQDGSVNYHEDLDIISTSTNSSVNAFSRFNATSAATAFASNFLAKLRDVYPNAWPETLRALMIHSSSWSEGMINQFQIDLRKVGDKQKLLRTVGYGIPNLEKAIECKSNYLTFISEETLQPYKLDGTTIKTNNIHYYEFPWPSEILANLGASDVTLRVTLSYYIEPNPGDKGYSTKYSYQSCALKFILIDPTENFENFKIRTNKINIDKLKEQLGVEKLSEGDYDKMKDTRWFLGADTVFKGSVHSNYWKGSAAEIAVCNKLAIFPLASGWWKQLKKQNKFNSQVRYSLVVSIETPENSTDIYTSIANQVAVQNTVKIGL
ncbi:S8 family peptidase [Flavobacterium sp. FlaQc-28]|uniref:S8 family peptidase n=1 Tax=Flavobacterium sp. FlaQc-28 TaxID=3374178 RepID=UPI003756976E